MLRSILAVLVAVLAWVAVVTVLNLGIRMAWPDYATAEPGMRFSLLMLIARLTMGAIASFAAGLIAVTIARRAKWPAYTVAIVLLLAFIPVHYDLWVRFPTWYHLVFLASLVLFTLLGATSRPRIRLRKPA
jgi:hypothetical protein